MTIDSTFAALADPTRRAMVARLGGGPATVSQLAQPFSISMPAVSKHLGVLERAGLVRRTKVGRTVTCELQPQPLHEAYRTLAQYRSFWEANLDRLAAVLEEESP